ERTRVLAFVLDMSNQYSRLTPWKEYNILLNELEEYLPGLSKRSSLVIANKMDLEDAEWHFEDFVEAMHKANKQHIPIIPISAQENYRLGDVAQKLRSMVHIAKEEHRFLIQDVQTGGEQTLN